MKAVEAADTWTPLCNVNMANFLVNEGYVNLAIKICSKFCDLYAQALLMVLLCCKLKIIMLKTAKVAETQTLIEHVYKVKFVSKSRVCNSTLDQSSVTFVHMACLYSNSCKFQIIILKTVGVVETRTLLCHVYKAELLRKSQVRNSSNKIWSEFCELHAHAQSKFLLRCRFQIIILKTVEVA